MLPISHITESTITDLYYYISIPEHFYPQIVSLPNGIITELGITELFYYGLLIPNVVHSLNWLEKTGLITNDWAT